MKDIKKLIEKVVHESRIEVAIVLSETSAVFKLDLSVAARANMVELKVRKIKLIGKKTPSWEITKNGCTLLVDTKKQAVEYIESVIA